ncbi:MAG: transporter substrate-binding domain-containing protein [Kordiimonadaceae bacterium]|nr:transporter substrate-binding domain-containing protein [Kordiimonadaceae bacterium]
MCLFVTASFLPFFSYTVRAGAEHDGFSKIPIEGPEMGAALTLDGAGLYADFWRLMFAGDKMPPLKVLPHNCGIVNFSRKVGNCQFPAMLAPEAIREGVLFSHAFSIAIAALIPGRDVSLPTKLEEIVGKSIVVPGRYVVEESLKRNDIVVLSEMEQQLKMLITGRVDYMIATLPAAQLTYQKLQLPYFSFEQYGKLNVFPLHLKCNQTPATQKLVQMFNKNFKARLEDGLVHQLFQTYGLSYADYAPSP